MPTNDRRSTDKPIALPFAAHARMQGKYVTFGGPVSPRPHPKIMWSSVILQQLRNHLQFVFLVVPQYQVSRLTCYRIILLAIDFIQIAKLASTTGNQLYVIFVYEPYCLNSYIQENVGIVEFNSSARVVQSLTNNYQRCRRAIGESLL